MAKSMVSQVTFWVRHGDTTDPLVEFIDKADLGIKGATVIASDFIVDIESPNPGCSCGEADLGAPGHNH